MKDWTPQQMFDAGKAAGEIASKLGHFDLNAIAAKLEGINLEIFQEYCKDHDIELEVLHENLAKD